MASGVSFAQDILPLFTQTDIEHMQGMGVSLNNYSYMSQPDNASAVYQQVSTQQMPPPPEGAVASGQRFPVQSLDGRRVSTVNTRDL